MKKRLELSDIEIRSFVTSPEAARAGREVLPIPGPTNNLTIFAFNCCSGFTCGVCAYPETIPNPNCYEEV